MEEGREVAVMREDKEAVKEEFLIEEMEAKEETEDLSLTREEGQDSKGIKGQILEVEDQIPEEIEDQTLEMEKETNPGQRRELLEEDLILETMEDRPRAMTTPSK